MLFSIDIIRKYDVEPSMNTNLLELVLNFNLKENFDKKSSQKIIPRFHKMNSS